MSLTDEAAIIAGSLRRTHPSTWAAFLIPLKGEARYVEARVRASDPALWETIIAAGLSRAQGVR